MNAVVKSETNRNTSGLKPVGVAVLVEPFEPEFKKSIIQIPVTVRMRTILAETRAIVVEIGPRAWLDEGAPRCSVGDKVLITRYAGTMITGPKDQKIYRFVNDRDIFCVIEADAWPVTETVMEDEKS
jgi:co-chaperonin GroES (HSP10)